MATKTNARKAQATTDESLESSAPQGPEATTPAAPEPVIPEPAVPEPVIPEPAVPELESVSLLAERHRVPGWQLAALLRFTGWNDDKMIRDEAFRQALAELKNRRTGGGRR